MKKRAVIKSLAVIVALVVGIFVYEQEGVYKRGFTSIIPEKYYYDVHPEDVPVVVSEEELEEITLEMVQSAPVTPEEDFIVSILTYQESSDGGAKIENMVCIRYTGTDAIVVIPEEIDGTAISGITKFIAPNNNGAARAIVIPEGVVSIGPEAFMGNEVIEKIIFPDNLGRIETSAFENCINLNEVVFGTVPLASCLANRVYDNAFINTSLTRIRIPLRMSVSTEAFDKDVVLCCEQGTDTQNTCIMTGNPFEQVDTAYDENGNVWNEDTSVRKYDKDGVPYEIDYEWECYVNASNAVI